MTRIKNVFCLMGLMGALVGCSKAEKAAIQVGRFYDLAWGDGIPDPLNGHCKQQPEVKDVFDCYIPTDSMEYLGIQFRASYQFKKKFGVVPELDRIELMPVSKAEKHERLHQMLSEKFGKPMFQEGWQTAWALDSNTVLSLFNAEKPEDLFLELVWNRPL